MAGERRASKEEIADRRRAIMKLVEDGQRWSLIQKAICLKYEISPRTFRRDVAALGSEARERLEDVDALDVEFLAAIERLRSRAAAADKAHQFSAANQADLIIVKLLGQRKAAGWTKGKDLEPDANTPAAELPSERRLLAELKEASTEELLERKRAADAKLAQLGLSVHEGGKASSG